MPTIRCVTAVRALKEGSGMPPPPHTHPLEFIVKSLHFGTVDIIDIAILKLLDYRGHVCVRTFEVFGIIASDIRKLDGTLERKLEAWKA